MSATTTTRKTRQQRPLAPVEVISLFVGSDVADLQAGSALLMLQRTDNGSPEESYWAKGLLNNGRLYGISLTKCFHCGNVAGEYHTVQLDGLSCDCQDATYRSGRPGGCKHVAGLRQALPRLLNRNRN